MNVSTRKLIRTLVETEIESHRLQITEYETLLVELDQPAAPPPTARLKVDRRKPRKVEAIKRRRKVAKVKGQKKYKMTASHKAAIKRGQRARLRRLNAAALGRAQRHQHDAQPEEGNRLELADVAVEGVPA